MSKLRSYQQQAINTIFRYFKQGNRNNPLIVAPTGSGKSHIIAGFCAAAYERYPKGSILILTHTKEIIQQNAKILRQYVDPSLVGIYSSGLKSRQIRHFTIASIQTVYKLAPIFQEFTLVIVDEAHLIPPDGEGRYQTFFKRLNLIKTVFIIGFTATPFRRGHGLLTEGHIFDRVIYDIEIDLLIKLGHLVPLTSKLPSYVLDVKGIKSLGGDYSKTDLSRKLDHQHITNTIVNELLTFKELRNSWLVFAIDIEHCEHIAAQLNKCGIVAAAVHSKLDIDRQHLLDLFKAGHLQALVAVETLTTGFDAPNVNMIVLMRPTQSPVLHVQMLGRGMRPYKGKDNCLVLDFAGNVRRLGPVDSVQVKKKRQKGSGNGTGFTRTCPECKEILHISKKVCPCGYVFPISQKLSTQVDEDSPLLKSQSKVYTKKVKEVVYTLHKKPGKKPSFKVTYICGPLAIFHTWIAFEHKGYPRFKAISWWQQQAKSHTPTTVEEAIARSNELKKPQYIKVEHTGRYPNIIGYTF